MPTTINGVGTHYYGHKNSQTRAGTCRSCGRSVTLESYDTKLWFVIVYIPIIPLGRKRILDQCPICKRHYVAEADQWETQKQLNVSGALERYRSDPTPEHAIEAHQQLLNFHQTGDAAELRREMAEKFRQNAKVQAYLGIALTNLGLPADGLTYFKRAFELRPDLPEARVGLANDHIRAGQLAEARTLLDFLEKPGAVQLYSLEPIETLADAYARAGSRKEALELYRVLLEGLPQIGEIAAFRTKVKNCEKVVGGPSMLPQQKFSWKRFFGNSGGQAPGQKPVLTWRGLATVGAIALIIAICFAWRNEYVRRHRPLYLVNAFRDPATVEVQGVGTVRVGGKAERLEVKEGHYHAIVTGPIRQEFDFDVDSPYWDRWSNDDDAWVINVGGESLLLETRATYAPTSPPPPTIRPHFGRPIERVAGVTHAFVPLPETVQMKSGETKVLVHLERSPAGADNVVSYLQSTGRTDEALRLAEWRLRGHPDDEICLGFYASFAEPKRVEEFLRSGLQRRPVALQWHRAYQSLRSTAARSAWLAVEYDQMLQADPKNASLVYLRGRLVDDPARAEEYYNKARELDPQNPYPFYALGYMHASRGDWEGGRPFFVRAAELKPEQSEFANVLFSCRLALQEYPDLEKELRAILKVKPEDYAAAEHLVDVLTAQDRNTEARAVVDTYGKDVARLRKGNAAEATADLRRHLYYAAGDFAALADSSKNDRSPAGRKSQFIALLEQRQMAEAVRIHPLNEPKVTDPYHFLAVSIAWAVAGDPATAEDWLRRGAELLASGPADDVRAAALLLGKAEPTSEQLASLGQPPKGKAILFAALGMRRPEKRAELFGAVQKLNVDRDYPFQLIRRVTTGAR